LLVCLAVASPAFGQASFEFAPPQPLTGDSVTFTSTSGPGTVTWDLDADSVCDDASGTPITQVFPTAGSYRIKICLSDGSDASRLVVVGNRPPVPTFDWAPKPPVARELVTLTSTSVDPDGPIVAQVWDLDGDGAFDDATGETAKSFWRRAGTYPVSLQVTDRDGATAVATLSVVVEKRPPRVFSESQLIRFLAAPTTTGAHLTQVSVTAPKGANVGIRCKGGNCPYKRKRFTSKGKRVFLRKLGRIYAAGTVIELRVTRSETIGKFTRVRIRAGREPARLDRCLRPGRPEKPIKCDRVGAGG
jgi:PKD repeat protein